LNISFDNIEYLTVSENTIGLDVCDFFFQLLPTIFHGFYGFADGVILFEQS
jgi:hypothetical protein